MADHIYDELIGCFDIKMFIVAFCTVAFTVGIYILFEKSNFFRNFSYKKKQIFVGVIFGLIAIFGTEFGISVNSGASGLNVRDAAVFSAGMFFGGPAGIIAGLIGGIERYLASFHGVGVYTQVACTIATIGAGFLSAFLRKHLFWDKKPQILSSTVVVFSYEVFHMFLVILTNGETADKAVEVVLVSTIPLVFYNALVMLVSSFIINSFSFWADVRKSKKDAVMDKKSISSTFERILTLSVIVVFFITNFFLYKLQENLTFAVFNDNLLAGVNSSVVGVRNQVDVDLIRDAKKVYNLVSAVGEQVSTDALKKIAEVQGVEEICLVNSNNIIINSNQEEYIGFNMLSEEQTAEFACLLQGETEFTQPPRAQAIDKSKTMKYVGMSAPYGYILIGFNYDRYIEYVKAALHLVDTDAGVIYEGDFVLCDRNRNILFHSGKAPSEVVSAIVENSINTYNTNKNLGKEKAIKTSLPKGEYFSMVNFEDELYVLVFYNSDAVYQEFYAIYFISIIIQVLISSILFILLYFLINKFVLKKIFEINSTLSEITSGEMDKRVRVYSHKEFISLSNSINYTIDTVKSYSEHIKEQIEKELGYAKQIQLSALPQRLSPLKSKDRFDIYAQMNTARQVGGDFYDFFFVNDNELVFLIADVSGKGIPAAMFMMRSKALIKNIAETGIPTADIFIQSNNDLCNDNDMGMFVTAFICKVDLTSGLFSFSNAGHNRPLIRQKGGDFEFMYPDSGFVLATIEDIQYKEQALQLEKDDIVFCYTDGVTEAVNSKGEFYGDDRLKDVLNRNKDLDIESLCKKVEEDLQKFVDGEEQFDDITMLAFKYEVSPEQDPKQE